MGSMTTLKVSKETRDRLNERGKMGDSFDDVIRTLLGDEVEDVDEFDEDFDVEGDEDEDE